MGSGAVPNDTYLPVVLEGKPQSCRPPPPLDCSEITFLTAQTGNHSSSTSLSLLTVCRLIYLHDPNIPTWIHVFFWDVSSNVAAASAATNLFVSEVCSWIFFIYLYIFCFDPAEDEMTQSN